VCRVSGDCQRLLNTTQSLQQHTQDDMTDLVVPLHLKNGAIEIDQQSVGGAARTDSVLVPRTRVSVLNSHVRERHGHCVHVLEEIRDFKVGIYTLLFDCKMLDMQAEDSTARIRDLQLLRVTADLNQVLPRPFAPSGGHTTAMGRSRYAGPGHHTRRHVFTTVLVYIVLHRVCEHKMSVCSCLPTRAR
jgi:hypothetical protein